MSTAALGLTLLGATPAVALPTADEVTLTAPAGTLAPGATVDVTLGLAAAADVFAYEATLEVDPDVLALDSVTATPPGGFDDVTDDDGTVTVRHTRLGTSPALDGTVPATTVRLRAVAGGTATVALSGLTLVGADGTTSVRTDLAVVDVTVVAPTPTPTPTPSATPVAAPTPPAPAAAAPADPAAPATATATTRTGPDRLSATGAQVGGLLAVAVAALALGTVLVRRRSAGAR